MPKPLRHDDLVLRAVRWLRRTGACDPVFAGLVSHVMSEIPDAIGWCRGASTLIEVKMSRADFLRDRHKMHAAHTDTGMGQRRIYLVPPGLLAAGDVPEWCGLAYARGRTIEVVKPAPIRPVYDFRAEAALLASALRRSQLGAHFDRKTGRWESYAEHSARTGMGAPEATSESGDLISAGKEGEIDADEDDADG
jgi:hypothetical protein